MSDQDTSLEELRSLLRTFRDQRQWKRFHLPKDLAIAISTEAAELLEHFQWHDNNEIGKMLSDPNAIREIGRECADILSFLLLFSDATGIDLSSELNEKLKVLEGRYPVEKVKGKNLKYDEY